MANKVLVATLFVSFLLIASCFMGAEAGSVCCTNPYTGCHKGNGADEERCNSFCAGKGCRGGECKSWANPAGQCHCYC
ncbi:unnamed protein product [Victoria cruziana]